MIAAIACCSCNNVKNEREVAPAAASHKQLNVKKSNPSSYPDKEKIMGNWTDGSTANATFAISKDSVYYVDQFKSYKYILHRDSINIYYDDYIYKAKFYFKGDSLIMGSQEYGVAKFWKFKKMTNNKTGRVFL